MRAVPSTPSRAAKRRLELRAARIAAGDGRGDQRVSGRQRDGLTDFAGETQDWIELQEYRRGGREHRRLVSHRRQRESHEVADSGRHDARRRASTW